MVKELRRIGAGLLLVLSLWLGGGVRFAAGAMAPEEIAQRVAPSVVQITGYMSPQSGEPYVQASGVFIGDGGLLVSVSNLFTDARSRRMCERYRVRLADGRERLARVLSVDAILNLVVLEMMEPGDYPAAEAGSGAVGPGDEVIALTGGSPAAATYAVGRVKARHKRSVYGAGLGDMFIDSQIKLPDHALGGPLLDFQGRVVGINTPNVHRPDTVPATAGESHAVPVGVVQGFLRMARAYPSTRQNWLGIAFRPLHPDEANAASRLLGQRAGVRVDFVWADGPAAGLDIRPGDILFSLNGKALGHLHELDRLLLALHAGDTAELALLRGGRAEFRRIQVQRRPAWAGYVAWRVQQTAAEQAP
jgi:S1-C subfamily serine protease